MMFGCTLQPRWWLPPFQRGSSWVDSADRTAYNFHGASRSLSETTERLAQYRTDQGRTVHHEALPPAGTAMMAPT